MSKIIITNKDAFYSYVILDKFEAGLELKGWEVKSIREKKVSIKGAFVHLKNNEAFLVGMQVSQYMLIPGDELRTRKILLHQSQIKKIYRESLQKGISVVALKLKWSKTNFIKIDIAIAKGKSKVDKREVIKQREISRKIKKVYNI